MRRVVVAFLCCWGSMVFAEVICSPGDRVRLEFGLSPTTTFKVRLAPGGGASIRVKADSTADAGRLKKYGH